MEGIFKSSLSSNVHAQYHRPSWLSHPISFSKFCCTLVIATLLLFHWSLHFITSSFTLQTCFTLYFSLNPNAFNTTIDAVAEGIIFSWNLNLIILRRGVCLGGLELWRRIPWFWLRRRRVPARSEWTYRGFVPLGPRIPCCFSLTLQPARRRNTPSHRPAPPSSRPPAAKRAAHQRENAIDIMPK